MILVRSCIKRFANPSIAIITLPPTNTNQAVALVEHMELMTQLRRAADANEKEERARAIQALRYAKRRAEGLIEWNFRISGIDRKELITWAYRNVQKYFEKA